MIHAFLKRTTLVAGLLIPALSGSSHRIHSLPYTEPTCASDLKRALLAYYPFNGNFKDASGNGNHAFPQNGAHLTTDQSGQAINAAGFDGRDDYIIVPGNSRLNADSFTISFLVLVNDIDRRNATVNRVKFGTCTSLVFGVAESLAEDNDWSFGVTPGKDDCSVLYGYDPSLAIHAKRIINEGVWHSVIATFGKGMQQIYIDGVQQGSSKRRFQTAKKCADADLVIGGWWSKDVISIDGKIDEVRLYGRVINECEIAKLASLVMPDTRRANRLAAR
jgi:hypothetical protein